MGTPAPSLRGRAGGEATFQYFPSDNVALQPRTKGKVRVSPKGWRTVFDFPSAKLWRKIDPRNTQKL